MGNKASKMVILAVCLFFLWTLTGCRENPEKSIIGEWRDLDDTTVIFEFTENGELIMWAEDSPNEKEIYRRGSYEFIGTYTINVSGLFWDDVDDVPANISFSEDVLTLTFFDPDDPDVKGDILRMKRIKNGSSK